MDELITINKLQQAKLAVQEVKALDEIKRIVDQSEALKNYARAQKLSEEVRNDIAEYSLYATRQLGIISTRLDSKQGKRTDIKPCPNDGQSKTELLRNAGVDRRRAAEAEKLAAIPEEKFAEIIAEKKETDELTKTAVIKAITQKPHIAQNSGNNEWYTPKKYIDAARTVMGDIDLDPASSDIANKIVGAVTYYTIETDGLSKEWNGRVWLNPPYSSDLIPLFIKKLRDEVVSERTVEAIVLVNNATETSWFSILVSMATAVIFPTSRVKFYMPDGKTGAPLQGQAVVYVGGDPRGFIETFSSFGWGAYI